MIPNTRVAVLLVRHHPDRFSLLSIGMGKCTIDISGSWQAPTVLRWQGLATCPSGSLSLSLSLSLHLCIRGPYETIVTREADGESLQKSNQPIFALQYPSNHHLSFISQMARLQL
ncbi:hypothetical protein V6N13_069367 [Hibiscus sabdariffa]|uniref:Uncharacterized protein n=1 Tax=Hibiscus sabdariffa TaxID=183260 RepID=A0ABR2PGG0_9ROSI